MNQPSSPTIEHTRLGPIEYTTSGTGPVVMALHGAMGGCDQSNMLMQAIGGPGYRTLAISRPGYLGTPLSSGRSPEEQADLCAELLDALGVGRVCVMAVSGGGPTAIHFALRHPQRCWGLVLVSTTACRVTQSLPIKFYLLRWFGRWPWFVGSIEKRARRDPDAAARFSIPDAELRQSTLADPVTGPLFRALNTSTATRIAERLAGTLNDVAITRSRDYPLEAIQTPTLVVHGGSDRLVPFEVHGKALASRIPNAQLITAPEGDHVYIYTHLHVVRPRVVQFLAEHAS